MNEAPPFGILVPKNPPGQRVSGSSLPDKELFTKMMFLILLLEPWLSGLLTSSFSALTCEFMRQQEVLREDLDGVQSI